MSKNPAFELFKTLRRKLKWMPVFGSVAFFIVYCIILSYPLKYVPHGDTTAPKSLFMLNSSIFWGTLFLTFFTFPKRQSIIALAILAFTIVVIIFSAP